MSRFSQLQQLHLHDRPACGLLNPNSDATVTALDDVIFKLAEFRKNAQRHTASDLWFDNDGSRALFRKLNDDVYLSSTGTLEPQVIIETFSHLRRLKYTRTILSTLTSSLDSLVQYCETGARRTLSHHGINSLPDELLAIIIQLSCTPPEADHVTFSGVCRRFRRVVINSSQLWTHFKAVQSQRWRELQLERSRQSGLTIYYVPATWGPSRCGWEGTTTYAGCCCVEFLEFALEHKRRWHTFFYATHHPDKDMRKKIYAMLSGLELPALARLVIDSHLDKESAQESDVCRSWSTPLLRYLRVIPKRPRGEPSFAHSYGIDNIGFFGSSDAISRLQSRSTLRVPQLPIITNRENFTMRVDHWLYFDNNANTAIPICDLRKLTLEFSIMSTPLAGEFLDILARSPEFPSLEYVSVCLPMDLHEQGNIEALLHWASRLKMTSLKCIVLSLYIWPKTPGTGQIDPSLYSLYYDYAQKQALDVLDRVDGSFERIKSTQDTHWTSPYAGARGWICKRDGLPGVPVILEFFQAPLTNEAEWMHL